MTFVEATERENTITVDGYSSAKTMKGAIADLGRYIKKHIDKGEGESLIEYKEESLVPAERSEGGYFLEVEDVAVATKINEKQAKLNTKTVTTSILYAESLNKKGGKET